VSKVIICFLDVFTIDESYEKVADLEAESLPLPGVWCADDLIEEDDDVFYVSIHEPEVEQHVPGNDHRCELPVVLGCLHGISHRVETVEQDRI
jgi:hypothetical protein